MYTRDGKLELDYQDYEAVEGACDLGKLGYGLDY
jgi:hypothetical protein